MVEGITVSGAGDTSQQGTAILPVPKADAELSEQAKCEAEGRVWDAVARVCLPKVEENKPEEQPEVQEGSFNATKGGFTTSEGQFFPTTNPDFKPSATTDQQITFDGGKVRVKGLSGEEVELTREEYNTALGEGGLVTDAVAKARLLEPDEQRRIMQQQQTERLLGRVGQFGQLPAEQGRFLGGIDLGESAIQGVTSAIPRAIGLAVAGAGAGATSGGVAGSIIPGAGTAAGASIGAVIGAVGGFLSGITGSMIGNMRGQRRDTTTAQQRVLDEGKQTLKDWATLARNDPSNKARYLAEYNKVAAQIDQAYRQMKFDVDSDVAKFETALPNLAEFEAFYAVGGERDVLDQEMQTSLLTPSPVDYDFYDLSNRRSEKFK